jgi:hypothetical protein
VLRADAITAQAHQAGIAQFVPGQTCDIFDFFAEVGKRNSNIRFAPTVQGFERTRLGKALKAGRRKTEHDLAEGNDLFHDSDSSDSV